MPNFIKVLDASGAELRINVDLINYYVEYKKGNSTKLVFGQTELSVKVAVTAQHLDQLISYLVRQK